MIERFQRKGNKDNMDPTNFQRVGGTVGRSSFLLGTDLGTSEVRMLLAIHCDLTGHIHHRTNISRVPGAFARNSTVRAMLSSVANSGRNLKPKAEYTINLLEKVHPNQNSSSS